MPLSPGTRLGPYEIVTSIGAGGMGEVYRARDTALQRDVAIKTLPPLFAGDAERLARFAREAQTLAALNHVNIAHVYGLEGTALVMELVEGEDLAQQLARGPIALDDALPVARQIAEALEAAHEQGIVHRDLKPANIKVRPDGTVKVLDFGLAKALEAPGAKTGSSATDADSPTVLGPAGPAFRSGVSQPGVILGTAAYMSPEQAKGKPVDRRADIWAFGCVLYEMLVGRPLFAGETITEILAAVMRDEPDWRALPAQTPPSILRLLRRCLARDPKDRLSDIGVARLEIRDAADVAPASDAAPPVRSGTRVARPWWMVAAGLVVGVPAAGVVAWRVWPKPASPPALRLTIDWPGELTWSGPSGTGLVLSPDGTHLAFVAATDRAGPQIYLRDLRGEDVRAVSAVDTPYNPFFSPDSAQVGFIAGGRLWRAPVAGGPPFEIGAVDVNDRGVAWSDDGYIYSGGGAGLSRIPESGGSREQITTVDRAAGEVAHRFPALVPGRGLLFTLFRGGSLDLEQARIAVVDLKTRKMRILMDQTGYFPQYAPDGHLLYVRAGVLMAARFDASRLEVTGPSTPVMSGILYNNGGASHYSLSGTGTFAYIEESGRRAPVDLLWVDRSGGTTPIDLPRGPYGRPELSPDGTRVVLEQAGAQGRQGIVVWDFARHALSTVTRGSGLSETPVWMPDGASLLFATRRQLGALGRIYRHRADGAGAPAQVTSGSLTQIFASGGEYPGSVSSDGTKVLYAEVGTPAGGVKQLDLATGQTRMLIPEARSPRLSPDGRWLAYRSSESGIPQVYVSPYPDVAGARWQVSTAGASPLRWSRDSTEIFYRGLGSNRTHMFVVNVGGSRTLAGVRPQLIADVPDSGGPDGAGLEEFDVAADGRFLLLKGLKEKGLAEKPTVPHVIVNWLELLKRTVPPDAR